MAAFRYYQTLISEVIRRLGNQLNELERSGHRLNATPPERTKASQYQRRPIRAEGIRSTRAEYTAFLVSI